MYKRTKWQDSPVFATWHFCGLYHRAVARAPWKRVSVAMQTPLLLAFQAQNLLCYVKLEVSQSTHSGDRNFKEYSHIPQEQLSDIETFSFLWRCACWPPAHFLETFLNPLLPKTKQKKINPPTKLQPFTDVRARKSKKKKEALRLLPMVTVPAREAVYLWI